MTYFLLILCQPKISIKFIIFITLTTCFNYAVIVTLNELNLIIFFIFNVLIILLINPINLLNVLILVELVWIAFYAITCITGYLYDDLTLLSLSFFFLLFSAAELITGFVLILIQNTLIFNISLSDPILVNSNYSTRLSKNMYLNKLI